MNNMRLWADGPSPDPPAKWVTWHYCEYCKKHVENGLIRNNRIYCGKKHALFGALKGEQK